MSNKSINSDSYAYLKSLISPQVEIIGIEVKNKWLCATLDNGIHFSVLNFIN